MASSEGAAGGGESALFSKLGGAFFGGPNSPQKVIANVRGLANRLSGAIPDTGKLKYMIFLNVEFVEFLSKNLAYSMRMKITTKMHTA